MENEKNLQNAFDELHALQPMSEENRERLWKKFRLEWNYNSNRIEGNTLTYGETEALLILGEDPKRVDKDIREMKAHDLAITHLENLVSYERLIDQADIRDLNKIILKDPYFITTITADGHETRKEIIPGEYKKDPNHVRRSGGGTHRFAEPYEVPARMERTVNLIRDYLKNQDKPLPIFLAELHHQFIATHPFDDGNGRVVRMLINYVCMKLDWPPVIIKDEKKSDYYVALEFADNGDFSLMNELFEREIYWSLSKSIAAAKGEAIDDDDDIDKEIEMFVKNRLNDAELASSDNLRSPENVSVALNTVVVPLLETLENRLNKYAPIFSDLHVEVTAELVKSLTNHSNFLSRDKLISVHNLRGFKGGNKHFDLKYRVDIIYSHDKVTVQYNPYVGGQIIAKLTFNYNNVPDDDSLKKFHQKVSQKLMADIKEHSGT